MFVPATAQIFGMGATRSRRPVGALVLAVAALLHAGPALAGTLENLIGEALRTHPAVQAQQARAGAAQAAVESAKWQFYPTPYATLENAGAPGNSSSGGDNTVTTVGLRQPLWTGGRLSAGLDKARSNQDAATAAQAQARLQLAIRVTQSYGDWLNAYRKRQAYDKGRIIHERLLAQVVRRIAEGQAAQSDQALAEGRLAALLADMSAAQTQERISLTRLSQLAGRTVAGATLARPLVAPLPLTHSLDALIGQARAASPVLAQYRALEQVELATIDERRADLQPEISVRLERQHGSFTSPGAPPHTALVVGLSSRFGAGLSNLSAIGEATSRHAAALADLAVQERDLDEQVMSDYALLAESEARSRALHAAIEQSDQVLQSWDRQFLVGRKTWQDLMGSAREQVQIEAQLAEVEGAQLVSSWRLALLCRGVADLLATNPGTPPR